MNDWPFPFSRLQALADDTDLDPDELRAYLRGQIERRWSARARPLQCPRDRISCQVRRA